MTCVTCGANLPAEAAFCLKCGAAVAAVAEAEPSAPADTAQSELRAMLPMLGILGAVGLVVLGLWTGVIPGGKVGTAAAPIRLAESGVTMVKVTGEGCWSGGIMTVAESSQSRTVGGCGEMSYPTRGASIVSVSFQKKDGDASRLRVELLSDSGVVASSSTVEPYGVVVVAK